MIGRARDVQLRWKPPEVANKTGESRKMYDQYCKSKTVKEFELMCRRKDVAQKGDMTNDLTKGWLEIGIPEGIGDEHDTQDYDKATYGQGGGDVEKITSVTFGMTRYREKEIRELKLEELEAVNLTYDESVDDEVILSITQVLKEQTEMKEVPAWMALAVYHNAEVYVDERKQPYTISEAMKLKEWEEWKAAVMKEIAGLIAMGVWKEVWRHDLKPGTRVLPGRMVLEIKTVDGKFDKCKARYVSRGDLSIIRGEHY
jgi:ferredoxin-fold anticodon binding domain-containing protein